MVGLQELAAQQFARATSEDYDEATLALLSMAVWPSQMSKGLRETGVFFFFMISSSPSKYIEASYRMEIAFFEHYFFKNGHMYHCSLCAQGIKGDSTSHYSCTPISLNYICKEEFLWDWYVNRMHIDKVIGGSWKLNSKKQDSFKWLQYLKPSTKSFFCLRIWDASHDPSKSIALYGILPRWNMMDGYWRVVQI